MRFVLFTDKTVAQCNSAIQERLQAPGTSSRPALNGWVEKNGRFSLALTAPVVGKFTRTTHLDAQVARENGQTVIRGNVPEGAGPQGQLAVVVALALVALLVLIQGQPILAFFVLIAGGVVLIPLKGDFENGDRLLIEVERTLKASPKPPKLATTRTTTTAKAVTARPPVKKPAGTARPVAAKSTGTRPAAAKAGSGKATGSKPAAGRPAAKPAAARTTGVRTTTTTSAVKKPSSAATSTSAARK